MSLFTAAMAVRRFFKLNTVIPCHYGSFPIIEPNADEFVSEMKGHPAKALAPKKGKAVSMSDRRPAFYLAPTTITID
jgi:L-ascorbate metabolism protein UlaG (beta-lactamase superfamily)